MQKQCVWVIGAKGMLGSQVAKDLILQGFDVLATGHEVDITQQENLRNYASSLEKKPSFIVNCAAYTLVDKAQEEQDKCFLVNKTGAFNVAFVAKQLSCPVLYISSDYVFSGDAANPIREEEQKSPLGIYAKSKAQGEDEVIQCSSCHYIFRTSWLYGLYGKNFVFTMMKLLSSKKSIRVVEDQRGTPTNCTTLSKVIAKTVELYCKKESPLAFGIYNVTDEGETTWHAFAKQIQKECQNKGLLIANFCDVLGCTTKEYNAPAPRPLYSVLDKSKIQKALDITLPHWKDCLASFIDTVAKQK